MDEDARTRARNATPIGYAARRVDETLTRYVGALLADFGVERGHWQLMRRTHENPGLSRTEFVASAAVFYDEDHVLALVEDLRGRGWLEVVDDDAMTLTPEGEHRFAAMDEAQEGTWNHLLEGLDYEDYLTAISTLETMIANLDRALEAR